MSDQSETASTNGEWERMSEFSNESRNEMEEMREENEKLREENEKMKREMETKDEEISKIRDENVSKDAELAMLRSQIDENVREEQKAEEETINAATKNLPVEKFLGTYTIGKSESLPTVEIGTDKCTWMAMIIRKDDGEGFFETRYVCENGRVASVSWIPDNVARGSNCFWIEGKSLYRRWCDNSPSRYEITDDGFIFNGCYAFIRL